MRHFDLAEIPCLHPFDGFLQRRVRAILRAGLHDAVVLPRRFHHLAAFPHIVRDRLFHIHILARLAAPDRNQRMPVIWRGGRDRVNVFVVQELAQVAILFDVVKCFNAALRW